jgi:WD40-like Beta Propeller Repeat
MQRGGSARGLAVGRSQTKRRSAGMLAFCGLLLATLTPGAGARALPGPYFSAPFHITKLAYEFGQAPSWTRTGSILSTEHDSAGISQIYRSKEEGGEQVCLTCTMVAGSNGLPQERPEGDWILFESDGQQPTHFLGLGLGGYGDDLYVMHPDGSDVYRLTTDADPENGLPFTQTTGTPYDNFHAYWSPDGRHIIWTHDEAKPVSEGGQTAEIMLGDFTVNHGRPELANVRVVGKPYGAYETQPWSPNGQGFLFFASGGHNSPFQPEPPGWGNARLYYMRIYGPGASPENPRVTLIGNNKPVYQEQAVFTPDMKDVIEMSNRDEEAGSWYHRVARAAQRSGFDAPVTGASQTLQFLADFYGSDFHSDLWMVDLQTGKLRRLTDLDGVVPEFYWNADYTKLLWGETPHQGDYTASFEDVPGQDAIPWETPPWLYGEPVDMERVGTQAQPIRDPGPTNNTALEIAPPENPAPAFPHREQSGSTETIPSVIVSYLPVWLADLDELEAESGAKKIAAQGLERLADAASGTIP